MYVWLLELTYLEKYLLKSLVYFQIKLLASFLVGHSLLKKEINPRGFQVFFLQVSGQGCVHFVNLCPSVYSLNVLLYQITRSMVTLKSKNLFCLGMGTRSLNSSCVKALCFKRQNMPLPFVFWAGLWGSAPRFESSIQYATAFCILGLPLGFPDALRLVDTSY